MSAQATISPSISFDKSALLQSGGEGAVYVQGGKAIKVFHRPQAQRSAKLKAFQSSDLLHRLPSSVLGPQRLLMDAQGMVTAFEMALLPPTARPFKKLTQAPFCQRYAIDLDLELSFLLALRGDLLAIHAAGAIVGDLNDHNVFFDWAPSSPAPAAAPGAMQLQRYWIDVDSYQFGAFPCPVALNSFLDPRLYGVADFSARPVFTQGSDWYAFAVLLCKTLLKTHPYGGVHHQLKTLQARAKAGVSVLHPSVTYPKAARRSAVLDDALLAYLRCVFQEQHREPPPEPLLQSMRGNLARCPACAQRYTASRPRCPYCQMWSAPARPARVSAARPGARARTTLRLRTLFQTSGVISHVFVQPSGQIFAIVRHGSAYRLARPASNGSLRELPLFSGSAGARFALFQDVLAVNVPPSDDVLLVDVGASHPRALQTVSSERFDGETVFAASPEALYRLAGGYILRGQVRRGHFLEDVAASAHRRRTQLWCSPHGDQLAGYQRLFHEHQFFTIDERGRQHVFSPATPVPAAARSIAGIDVAWDRRRVAYLWHEKAANRLEHHLQIASLQGDVLHQAVTPVTTPPYDRLDGRLLNDLTVLHPTDEGILKVRPQSEVLLHDLASVTSANATLHWCANGLLIQDSHALVLAQTDE